MTRTGMHDRVQIGRCGLAMLAVSAIAGLLTTTLMAAGTLNSSPLPLPISLLDLMRASVEIPAVGIWAAQGADKLTDDDWLLADQDSVSLAGAATLMSKPGTGKNDRKWVANADWQSWVRDVQKTALEIRAAGNCRPARLEVRKVV